MCVLVLLSFSCRWLRAFWWNRSTWWLLAGILCWRLASYRSDPMMYEMLFNAPAKWLGDQDFITLRGWTLWSRVSDLEPLRAPTAPPWCSRRKYSFMFLAWSESDGASPCLLGRWFNLYKLPEKPVHLLGSLAFRNGQEAAWLLICVNCGFCNLKLPLNSK